jgi:hypothetical protein
MTARRAGEAELPSMLAGLACGIWLTSEIFSVAATERSLNPAARRKSPSRANSSELPMRIGIRSSRANFGGVAAGILRSLLLTTFADCPVVQRMYGKRKVESNQDKEVCFSNRPIGVKRFSNYPLLQCDIARGLALLQNRHHGRSIIMKTRRNKSLGRPCSSSDGWSKNSRHPLSREGRHSTVRWSSSVLLLPARFSCGRDLPGPAELLAIFTSSVPWLPRGSPASSRLRTAICCRGDRSRRIDTARLSIRIPRDRL